MNIFFTCLLASIVLLGMPSSTLAFKVPIHGEITREVLTNFETRVGDDTFKFTEKAIKRIVEKNEATDDLPNQFESQMHFDDEDFPGGSKRVMDLKEKTITLVTDLQDPQGTAAQNRLGTALHTLQDFYAHSNWVELGHSGSEINTKLGREEFSGGDKGTPTCPDSPGTLGDAGLAELTSGYFLLEDQVACGVPQGKCRHGVPVICPTGLNKDDDSRTGFTDARALAVNATNDFLVQIFNDSRMKDNVPAIKLLMRIRN